MISAHSRGMNVLPFRDAASDIGQNPDGIARRRRIAAHCARFHWKCVGRFEDGHVEKRCLLIRRLWNLHPFDAKELRTGGEDVLQTDGADERRNLISRNELRKSTGGAEKMSHRQEIDGRAIFEFCQKSSS